MKVEWTETTEGTCSRCAAWNQTTKATWLRTFSSPAGPGMQIRYCDHHAEAARSMVAVA
jgi:hypothetical protein